MIERSVDDGVFTGVNNLVVAGGFTHLTTEEIVEHISKAVMTSLEDVVLFDEQEINLKETK